MAHYNSQPIEQVLITYTYKHPLGLRIRKAYIYCDCEKPGECVSGTKHGGEDKNTGEIILVLKDTDGWIAVNS